MLTVSELLSPVVLAAVVVVVAAAVRGAGELPAVRAAEAEVARQLRWLQEKQYSLSLAFRSFGSFRRMSSTCRWHQAFSIGFVVHEGSIQATPKWHVMAPD